MVPAFWNTGTTELRGTERVATSYPYWIWPSSTEYQAKDFSPGKNTLYSVTPFTLSFKAGAIISSLPIKA